MKIDLILVPYDSRAARRANGRRTRASRGVRAPRASGAAWPSSRADDGGFPAETTTGGFLDGMALATLTGRCSTGMSARLPGFVPVREQDAWLIGTRDLDPAEEEMPLDSLVGRVFVEAVGANLAGRVRKELDGPGQLHVHLDFDVLDPSEGRVNEHACEGGVSAAMLWSAVHALGTLDTVAALTLSAYDPGYDVDDRVCATAFAMLESFFTESRDMS